jgi:hypothetical protein
MQVMWMFLWAQDPLEVPLGPGSRLPLSSLGLSFLSIVATCTPRCRAVASLVIHTIAVAIYLFVGTHVEALQEQVFVSFPSLTYTVQNEVVLD